MKKKKEIEETIRQNRNQNIINFVRNAILYLYNRKSNGDNLCDILYAFGNIIR